MHMHCVHACSIPFCQLKNMYAHMHADSVFRVRPAQEFKLSEKIWKNNKLPVFFILQANKE